MSWSIFKRVEIRQPWECWPATVGVSRRTGYARWSLPGGASVQAHRYSYEHFTGEQVPDDLTIDHLCKSRACQNFAHMEIVTLEVNVLRSDNPLAINARKTHCIRGHAFDEANTLTDKHGYRRCRVCQNEKCRIENRKSRMRRKARVVSA